MKKGANTTGCCGGEGVTKGEACCKLDEDKKAEGKSGCGCHTLPNIKNGSAVAISSATIAVLWLTLNGHNQSTVDFSRT